MRRFFSSVFFGLAILVPTSASALKATQSVQKEITKNNADGTASVEYVDASIVAPGEKIVYTLNIENDGEQAASDIVLTMPVPNEVKFIEGSAEKFGAEITYSADNGVSFESREKLIKRDANGVGKPANSDDITHIRWLVSGPIPVGTSDSLSFKGILR